MTWQRTALIVALLALAVVVAIFAPDKLADFKELIVGALTFAAGTAIPLPKQSNGKPRLPGSPLLLQGLAITLYALFIAGCANVPGFTMDDRALENRIDNAAGAEMVDPVTQTSTDPDSGEQVTTTKTAGRFRVITPSVSPLLAVLDATGINLAGEGKAAGLVVPGFGQLISPADIRLESATFPVRDEQGKIIFDQNGEPITMTLQGLNVTASTVIAAQDAQIVAALEGNTAKTEAEAERYVRSLAATGEITATVADALMRYWVPSLPSGE